MYNYKKIMTNPINNNIQPINLTECFKSDLQNDDIEMEESEYLGISKIRNRWISRLFRDNKKYNLGSFTTETEAVNAINTKLIELYGLGTEINIKKKKIYSSEYIGVEKRGNSWRSSIHLNKKIHRLGSFSSESEAVNARNKKLIELHGPDTDINIKKKVKSSVKKCNYCNVEKSSNNFLYGTCTDCVREKDINKSNTLHRKFQILLKTARSSAKRRLEKGRIIAGEFNITIEHIINIWERQKGRCYYSRIKMNYDKREWKISLERLDQNKGYIEDNIVLCCQEFNSAIQWSDEKIDEMIEILNQNVTDNSTISFEFKEKDRELQENVVKTIKNRIVYYKCNYCFEDKKSSEYHKRKNNICLDCNTKIKDYLKTAKNTLKMLLHNAITNSATRAKTKHTKRDNSFNITFEYLVKLFYNQKGLCAYSKIPMTFGSDNKHWNCSLERIDVLKGYVEGNVCLICSVFNTFDFTISYKHDDESGESSGWTAKKFEIFLNSVADVTVDSDIEN